MYSNAPSHIALFCYQLYIVGDEKEGKERKAVSGRQMCFAALPFAERANPVPNTYARTHVCMRTLVQLGPGSLSHDMLGTAATSLVHPCGYTLIGNNF